MYVKILQTGYNVLQPDLFFCPNALYKEVLVRGKSVGKRYAWFMTACLYARLYTWFRSVAI